MTIRLNITDGEGVLLGTIELTEDELRRARTSPMGQQALVEDICSEAGVR
jgi:hypothetical protein